MKTEQFPQSKDLIAVAEAQRLLGVSHSKMSRIVKQGLVRHVRDPLDQRVKLVSRSEILALKLDRVDKVAA